MFATIWFWGVILGALFTLFYGFRFAVGLIGYNANRGHWSFNTLIVSWAIVFVITLFLHVVFGI